MHVAYLTGVYIHQDEPWYLNILCVRVTCKVHKSRKLGDNCTQVTCPSSWKGGRYLQETIPLGFHQCQLIAEKRWANTGPNSVASSFRTLGWSSSGSKALEGFKPLRSLITLSLETTMPVELSALIKYPEKTTYKRKKIKKNQHDQSGPNHTENVWHEKLFQSDSVKHELASGNNRA